VETREDVILYMNVFVSPAMREFSFNFKKQTHFADFPCGNKENLATACSTSSSSLNQDCSRYCSLIKNITNSTYKEVLFLLLKNIFF